MNKIRVTFFQRKPRKGFSFSLEYIFQDVRNRLQSKIDAEVVICNHYNDGYLTKIYNIIQAKMRESTAINHITGEVHFLNLLMNSRRSILTVLDCGMMIRKHGFAQKIVKWLYLSAPVSKARFVTAISEETKKQIISFTKCDPGKIKVIPVAVDPIYKPFPKEFNATKPVILHIGTGYNKNLVRLIQALKNISCHLTIIGRLSQQYLDTLSSNNINYSNEYNVSNERLLEKYKECDILSFVSTFEGFGMPIVEANAVERVVITSNISSMPEVANDAACLVDPFDTEAIRAGIIKLINDPGYRAELLENGRKNKLRFDADKIANSYYELYCQVENQAH